jgi:hypothetical protein
MQGYPTFNIVSPHNFTLGCSTKSFAIVNFTNVSTMPPGGAVSYTLLTAGSSAITQTGVLSPIFTYTITTPGTYTAVTRNNNNGCETRLPFSIVSNTVPPVIDSVNVPENNFLDCNNGQFVLKANVNSLNVSCSWNFAGATAPVQGKTVSVHSNSAAPTATLINNYSLTVTDNSSLCKSTTVIPVYQNLFPPIAKIGGANIPVTCSNHSVLLSNLSVSTIPPGLGWVPSTVAAFLWIGPGVGPPPPVSSSYTAYMPGTYTMVAKDMGNGCTSTTTALVIDNQIYPAVNNPVAPLPVCLDSNVAAISPIITSALSDLTYSWSSPAGAIVTGANTATLYTNAYGTYSVLVTNTVTGCASTGLLHVINCTGLGMAAENQAGKIIMFPNPANDIFSITVPENFIGGCLQVINVFGQTVYTTSVLAETQLVDVRGQTPGIYYIRIITSRNLLISSGLMKL